jgi:hypothetical protein
MDKPFDKIFDVLPLYGQASSPPPDPPSGIVIPTENNIDWSAKGVSGGRPADYTVFANVTDAPYNATGDGVTDDTTAIQDCIDACPAGQQVYIPTGNYVISSDLDILGKGIQIKGDGPGNTRILYSGVGPKAIHFRRFTSVGSEVAISGSPTKDTATITVASAAGFSIGNTVAIYQSDDAEIDKSGSASSYGFRKSGGTVVGDEHRGQYAEITNISGNDITIEPPLYFDVDAAQSPLIRTQGFQSGCAVTDLEVEGTNGTRSSGDGQIQFTYCIDSWMYNVKSLYSGGDHFRVKASFRCTVEHCWAENSYSLESGRGYGYNIQESGGDHLIQDNVAVRCRHAYIAEGTAHGCVWGYNYSIRGIHNLLSGGENWVPAQLNHHGAHPHHCLFEGNIVEKLTFDETHGSSSHNTVFRNWIVMESVETVKPSQSRKGIDLQFTNHYYNAIVGNVLGESGITGEKFALPLDDDNNVPHSYALGLENNGGGDIYDANVPATTHIHRTYDYISDTEETEVGYSSTLPDSLYLSAQPSWWGVEPWPPIGPDLTPKQSNIPAKTRYEAA